MILYGAGSSSMMNQKDRRQIHNDAQNIKAKDKTKTNNDLTLLTQAFCDPIWELTSTHLPLGAETSPTEPAPVRRLHTDALAPSQHLNGNHSFTSSTSTLIPSKADILTMDLESKAPLPPKKYDSIARNLRWTFFSVYRRLNLLVLLPNIIAIIVLAARYELFNLSPQIFAIAVASNITASILVRQEFVINILFATFGACPQCFPLRIRRLAAKIYHLGGVHSGAGMAATVWFLLFTVAVAGIGQEMDKGIRIAIITITIILDALLLSIIILAHPKLRALYHNAFEQTHRFAGWTAVALFWALFFLLTVADHQQTGFSIAKLVCISPVFWMLFVVTISLILPWIRLRKVPVQAEALSSHAIRLHFTYTNTPLCAAPRISDNPLKEWHAFAAIPEEDGVGFSIIVSKAGDWTSKIIAHPPTHLWVRGIPTRGVLHVAPIFKRIVLVATGSGIGPCLALVQAKNIECRIIWSTPDPVKTYRKGIMNAVLTADPNATIINTTESGRPNLIQLAWNLYNDAAAEACFIISNPRVTRKFVYGLESRGVPTFAPIFDS